MKVRAIEKLYYDVKRYYPGDEFIIDSPEHFSERSMEKIEEGVRAEKPAAKKPQKQLKDDEVI